MRMLMVALYVICGIGIASAQSDSDRARIENVISSQLDAFVVDDGERAFSYAAPVIRRMFGDEQRFMAMVRSGYPPVYRPASHAFGRLREAPEGILQEVLIQDASGEEWLALYTMEQQPDGSWLIAGCRLLRRPGIGA